MLQSAADVFPAMGRYVPFAERRIQISSLLTCLGCFKQYGRSFKGKDDFEYLLGGGDWFEQQVGYETGTTTTTTIKQSEHDHLVEETKKKKKKLPDECPKLNRAQSTRDNNRKEVMKLIMWLLLGHKNESDVVLSCH